MDSSIWEKFMLGGPVMWLMVPTSVIALTLIIERVQAFMKLRQDFNLVLKTLEPLISSGTWDRAAKWCLQHNGPFSRVVLIYIRERNGPQEVRDDMLRREGLIIIGYLDYGLRRIAMLAQISTLLGLLATFHVMIARFSQGQMSSNQSANFTAAVWEALLTTMYGLLIAIPCSATYQILEGKVDAMARNLDILVSYLDEWRRNAEALPQGELRQNRLEFHL